MRPRCRACIRVAAPASPLPPQNSRVRVLARRSSGGARAGWDEGALSTETGSRAWLEWRADARARAEVGGGSGRAAEGAEGVVGVDGAEGAEGTDSAGGVEGAKGAESAAAAAAAALVLRLLYRASSEPLRDIGGERGAASRPRVARGAAAEASAALQAESVAPLCRLPPRRPSRRPSGEGCPSVAADGDGSAPAAPMRRPEVDPPRTGSNPSCAAPPTPAPPTPSPESGAARPELGTPDAVASYRPMLPRSRRALLGEGGGCWDSASSADSAGTSAAGAARGCRRA
eukprot:scaffold9318_cov29-Phaeocystis_antarctica.AAC.1